MVMMTLWYDTHFQNTQNNCTQQIKGEFDRNMDTQVTFQVALKPLNRSQNHLKVKKTAETKRERSDNLLVQSEMTLCVRVCVCPTKCVLEENESLWGHFLTLPITHLLSATIPVFRSLFSPNPRRCWWQVWLSVLWLRMLASLRPGTLSFSLSEGLLYWQAWSEMCWSMRKRVVQPSLVQLLFSGGVVIQWKDGGQAGRVLISRHGSHSVEKN